MFLEIRIEIVLLRLSCLYIAFIIDRHIGKSKKCLTYDYHLNQKANHKFILHFRNMDTQLLLKLYIRRNTKKLIKRSIETIVDKVSIANVCSSFFAKRSKLSECWISSEVGIYGADGGHGILWKVIEQSRMLVIDADDGLAALLLQAGSC